VDLTASLPTDISSTRHRSGSDSDQQQAAAAPFKPGHARKHSTGGKLERAHANRPASNDVGSDANASSAGKSKSIEDLAIGKASSFGAALKLPLSLVSPGSANAANDDGTFHSRVRTITVHLVD